MNYLRKYFDNNQKRWITKWLHYFNVYDRHFSKFINQPINILEIGVNQGGSLQMWKSYFGEKATIYGVDIDYRCKNFEEDGIKIFIGSQEDRSFLKALKNEIPKLDIIIDDGGHTMSQQIITFEEMFDHVCDGGVYLCEDLHTSYWASYGGGYKQFGSFIEYSKNFIDYIHAWRSQQPELLEVSEFTRSASSLHYYESILVIEKENVQKPITRTKGNRSYNFDTPKNLEQAIFHCHQEVNLNPQNPLVYRNLADVLAETGETEASISAYQKSLQMEEHPATYLGLAKVQHRIGDLIGAVNSYQKVLQLKDNYPFWICLSILYKSLADVLVAQGKLNDAIEIYQKAIDIEPQNVSHYINLAIIQQKYQDFNGAISNYQKALTFRPKSFLVYRNLGEVLSHQKEQQDAAITAYEEAVAIKPNSPNILLKLAHLCYNQGQDKKTAYYCQKAIEQKANLPNHLKKFFQENQHLIKET